MSGRFTILALIFAAAACGGSSGREGSTNRVATSGSSESGSSGGTSASEDDPSSTAGASAGLSVVRPDDTQASENCGDGVLDEVEECDDGNTVDNDGCAGTCLQVDVGYSCARPGFPCFRIARCGDGVVVPPEICDDKNTKGGDGCSVACQLEFGYKCEGEPSTCEHTVCGDGKKEGAESCDDGNTLPFDGCSAVCQTEPDCTEGACKSSCGDGLVLGANEECDDANNNDGDGCSKDCKVEEGFTCSQDATCEQIDGKCILRVPAVFRDFEATPAEPDFEVSCDELVTGIVKDELDGDWKPVLASATGACISSEKSFSEWYRDSPRSKTVMGDIVLFENGNGGYVNRFGPNGEQWQAYSKYLWTAPTVAECAASGCVPCDFQLGVEETAACTAELTKYDGNPTFFPLDDVESSEPRYAAKIPPQYFDDRWPYDYQLIPEAKKHNFYFTTEVTYWFKYDANQSAKLEFTGDDDVWVFVNGKLAVDLGGLHAPEDGSVLIDSTTADTYGMKDGEVYRISVFHAERKRDGSSFKLTLAGFKTSRSSCSPKCGDGIVSLGEECDDGKNEGGYGMCAPGCKLGAYCGDGIIQAEAGERCDNGTERVSTNCSASCRKVLLR